MLPQCIDGHSAEVAVCALDETCDGANTIPVLGGGGSLLPRGINRPPWDVFSFRGITPSPPPLGHLFVMFNDFHRLWTKMPQLFAPAGIPKAKVHEQPIFSVKYKNFLAPQATPKRNSNILMENNMKMSLFA